MAAKKKTVKQRRQPTPSELKSLRREANSIASSVHAGIKEGLRRSESARAVSIKANGQRDFRPELDLLDSSWPSNPIRVKTKRPKLHILKCWMEPFDALRTGLKHHEIRKDDRGFKVGDHLLLKRWDEKKERYTGKQMQVEVTYKTNGGEFGLPKKLCVLSIQHIDFNGTRLCCAMLHPSFNAK